MNLVADSVEKYLNEYGICYKRNSPKMPLSDVIAESNSEDYTLHLAIHSNAAGEGSSGEITGSEVYYYPTSEKGRILAEIIAKNMKSIYPDSKKVLIKTSSSFAELRKTKAPSVLVEIAYHDNENDAKWIRNNVDQIGRVLALSIKEYTENNNYCPSLKPGEVITMGGNLNLREGPSLSSKIVSVIPNGSEVLIIDCNGKWYKIRYNETQGYVCRHYISAY